MRCVHTVFLFQALVTLLLTTHINAVQYPFKSVVNWAKQPPFHKISLGRGNDGSGLVDMNATSSNGIAQESPMSRKPDYDYYYDYNSDYDDSDKSEEYEGKYIFQLAKHNFLAARASTSLKFLLFFRNLVKLHNLMPLLASGKTKNC